MESGGSRKVAARAGMRVRRGPIESTNLRRFLAARDVAFAERALTIAYRVIIRVNA
jgi:FAD synthase